MKDNNRALEEILSRLLVNALLGCEAQTDDEVKEQEMRNEVVKDINGLRSALSNVETKSAKENKLKLSKAISILEDIEQTYNDKYLLSLINQYNDLIHIVWKELEE